MTKIKIFSAFIILIILNSFTYAQLIDSTGWKNNWYGCPEYMPRNIYHCAKMIIQNDTLYLIAGLWYEKVSVLKDLKERYTYWDNSGYLYENKDISPLFKGFHGYPYIAVKEGQIVYDTLFRRHVSKGNYFKGIVNHRIKASRESIHYSEAWDTLSLLYCDPLTVSMNGPDLVEGGHTAEYISSISGGVPSGYYYKWYKDDFGNGISTTNKSKRPECWEGGYKLIAEGYDKESVIVAADCGSFNLKLVVSDGYGNTNEYIKFVTVMYNNKNLLKKNQLILNKLKSPILKQNYPNPFNPNTNIEFYIPNESFVKLSIFNLMGEEIRILQDGILAKGNHRIVWDGKDKKNRLVPSGVYFYKLFYGNSVLSKKMIFSK